MHVCLGESCWDFSVIGSYGKAIDWLHAELGRIRMVALILLIPQGGHRALPGCKT